RQQLARILRDVENRPTVARGWAATMLGYLGGKAELKTFERELFRSEQDPTVRRWIINGIYRTESVQGARIIARAIREDPDPDVRRRAILRLQWLAELSPLHKAEARRQAGKALIDRLSDTDSNCARQAALTLGVVGEERALPHLIAALQKDWLLWSAIAGLGYLGDPRAVSHLTDFLQHENSDIRAEAIFAQGEIGRRAPGAEALQKAVQPLLGVLDRQNEVESLQALRALEGILGPQKTANLIAGMAIQPDESQRHPGLLRGLSWLVDKESAFAALKDKLYDGNEAERRAAEKALRSMGLAQAVEVLVRKRVGELYREYYAEPIKRLEDSSLVLLEDTVQQVKRSFWISAGMSVITFAVGIGVLVAGTVFALRSDADPAQLFAGAGGIIAGILTVLGNFAVGPLRNIQKALADLAQVETSFLSFIRRIGLASLTFAHEYLQKEKPDPKMLQLATNSMKEATQDTLLMIEVFSGGGDSIDKVLKEEESANALRAILLHTSVGEQADA
ncbi:MAG: HEAT repeat domain-containing protein, partial [Anaerolineae bacterium]